MQHHFEYMKFRNFSHIILFYSLIALQFCMVNMLTCRIFKPLKHIVHCFFASKWFFAAESKFSISLQFNDAYNITFLLLQNNFSNTTKLYVELWK